MLSRIAAFCFFVFLAAPASAQTPKDAALPVQVLAGANPPGVLLSWPNPGGSDIELRRREKGVAGNTWAVLITEQNTSKDGFFDPNVAPGKTYEYAVSRKTGSVTAVGFALAAVHTPLVDQRGKILVFIDSTTADALGADLKTFKDDLRGEGWQILAYKTGPYSTVKGVKNQILGAYNADPANVKAVLLMGAVPVPYSGSTARDERTDHTGAWPSDAYYGELDGIWTDQSVNLPNTTRAANRNVPGDGKFDQNTLPSAVELPVGRLDFRRLSPAVFGAPPVELLRRYLLKNHLWRTGRYKTERRALVDDNTGWAGGEAFAAGGYRNAYPLMRDNQVIVGDFLKNTNPQSYLMGYGSAAAGSYNAATGVGGSADFAKDTLQMVFAQLYGPYIGDWDFETNPLLPAALASRGGILACLWSGRPQWFLHALAAGETIGYCLKETQNAQYNTAYGDSKSESGTHIGLLGDPTVRAQIVAPATELNAVSNCDKVNLGWKKSADPEIQGYLVYRSADLDGPYTRLTPNPINETAWVDPMPPAGPLFYSVRAVKMETLPGGGSWQNASTGAPQPVVFVPDTPPTALGKGGVLTCAVSSLILGVNFQPAAATYQWYRPDGTPLNGVTAKEPGVYTVVVTAPNGCTAAAFATVAVDTFLPAPNLPSNVLVTCAAPAPSYTVPAAPPGVGYTFGGVALAPGQVIQWNTSGVFKVASSANGCSKSFVVNVQKNTAAPMLSALTKKATNPGAQDGSIDLIVGGGAPPFTYAWSHGTKTEDVSGLSSGTYTVTVTGSNACTAALSIPLITSATRESETTTKLRIAPNPADALLNVFFENEPRGEILLRLCDLNGRNVAETRGRGAALSMDVSVVPAGVYVLWVETAEGRKGFRVLID
jgi:hypothetical protein